MRLHQALDVAGTASHAEECRTSEGSGQQLSPTGRQDAINGMSERLTEVQ